jgi:hypothetical protein
MFYRLFQATHRLYEHYPDNKIVRLKTISKVHDLH